MGAAFAVDAAVTVRMRVRMTENVVHGWGAVVVSVASVDFGSEEFVFAISSVVFLLPIFGQTLTIVSDFIHTLVVVAVVGQRPSDDARGHQ